MKHKLKPLSLEQLKTYPLKSRNSKVSLTDFAVPWESGGSFQTFIDKLPNILAATDLKAVTASIIKACQNDKAVVFGMGAHVIKVGLNPLIIDLMERGVVSAVAMNGAGIIHDFELAYAGCTSEDVAASLSNGSFGMAQETGEFLGQAVVSAGKGSSGLGRAVGTAILDSRLPFVEKSILAAGARLDIPVTVHIAIGTDIIHMHPAFSGSDAGKASHIDFRIFASVVSDLEDGVYLNIGSSVILPEVFLKAITLARNLGHPVNNFTTVNMDFIRHYRPMTNVVNRPTAMSGQGYNLVGHHEIMLPLIAAGVIEKLR